MKTSFKILVLAFCCSIFLSISGCSSVIDVIEDYNFQLAVHMAFDGENQDFNPVKSKDTTRVSLYDYTAYRDNKDKIKMMQIYQFAYWITRWDGIPERTDLKNPPHMTQVDFYIQFNRDQGVDDKTNTLEPERTLLGSFTEVDVNDFYYKPHVLQPASETVKLLEESFKSKPRFVIYSEYNREGSNIEDIDKVQSQVDVVLRVTAEPK